MIKNNFFGKFIVFEGLDGSGQTTQANSLKDFLVKKGYKVVLTKEPTLSSKAGREIRKILDKEKSLSPRKLQEFFAQDRRKHLKDLIIPALKQKKIVISDRYFFSSLAYGSAEGLSLNQLIKLNKKFLMPDLTFILKVKPETCIKRIKKRGTKRTLFEKKLKLKKVWGFYEILPEYFKGIGFLNKVYVINGERPVKEVSEEIKKIVYSNLLK